MDITRRLEKLERDIPDSQSGDKESPRPTWLNTVPGPTLLGAAKILLELGLLSWDSKESAFEELEEFVQQFWGLEAHGWTAYWEYKACLEALTEADMEEFKCNKHALPGLGCWI